MTASNNNRCQTESISFSMLVCLSFVSHQRHLLTFVCCFLQSDNFNGVDSVNLNIIFAFSCVRCACASLFWQQSHLYLFFLSLFKYSISYFVSFLAMQTYKPFIQQQQQSFLSKNKVNTHQHNTLNASRTFLSLSLFPLRFSKNREKKLCGVWMKLVIHHTWNYGLPQEEEEVKTRPADECLNFTVRTIKPRIHSKKNLHIFCFF